MQYSRPKNLPAESFHFRTILVAGLIVEIYGIYPDAHQILSVSGYNSYKNSPGKTL
jgi:hypothetical protein